MTKRNIGDEIIKGMEEAIGHMRGKKTRVVVNKLEIPDDMGDPREAEVIKTSIC